MTKVTNAAQSEFSYSGKDAKGQPVKGEIFSASLMHAKIALKKQGIEISKIQKKSKPLFSKRKQKITALDTTIFTRQLATMLSSGIPLVQAFDIVGRSLENPSMQELVLQMKADVETGTTLAEALAKHPKHFNDLFCNLVEAGEQSGSLDTMLDNLATYKEKTESLKRKIKKALFYPAAVLVVAFIVSAALLIFVVPQFESLFAGFGAQLPAMTRMVITLSKFMQSYWYLIFGGIAGAVYGVKTAIERSPQFALQFDKALLKIPVIGIILRKSALARFARTLAITFAAGLPLIDALKAVAGTTGNLIYQYATLQIREQVSTGTQLQTAVKNAVVFPNMVIQMIAIGEESGSLDNMLKKIADYYEEEVDTAVDGLSSLLEPLIMALLGVIVGGLVIAMYLPIFQLGQVV